jgi:pimeloyl-ACP methyl ester carboxylesterase
MAVFTETPEPIYVTTNDRCRLELRRHPGGGAGATRPVLLVHGASAGSDTFRIGEKQTVVDYLLKAGFDVWTLDWRASMRCSKYIYCAVEDDPTIFTVDAAASNDVPYAISQMRANKVVGKIGIIGHCMGGAIVAQGIAQGAIPATDVENVVITALGLFYKAALDDVLKVEDQALEQLLADRQYLLHPMKKWALSVCTEDPGNGNWDPLLQKPYEIWLKTPLRHACNIDYCHRVSYMFGMPYLPDNIPSIHKDHLPSQFGYIPMQFLLHCAQNLRRGHCGRFVPNNGGATLPPDYGYLNHEPFRDRALTLITGNLNSLWHRDSIDTMYEWLRRGRNRDQQRIRKHVLDGFGHQDLYWGSDAPKRVFPLILEGLQDTS